MHTVCRDAGRRARLRTAAAWLFALPALVALAGAAAGCSGGGERAGPQGDDGREQRVNVGAKPRGVAVDTLRHRLYTANEADGTVSVVDTGEWRVLATLAVGSGPSAIAVNPATGRAYVSGAFSDDIAVIDGEQVVARVAVGRAPLDVLVDSESNRVYVANSRSDDISVVDGAANAVAGTLGGVGEPVALAISPDGRTLYVASAKSGTLDILDIAADTVRASVQVGGRPSDIALDAGRNRAYLSDLEGARVVTVDLETLGVAGETPVGQVPQAVAVGEESGCVFVANFFSDTISVLDSGSRPLREVPLPSGARPMDVTVVHGRLFVASEGISQVAAFEADTLCSGAGG